jgi:hypothetical protein
MVGTQACVVSGWSPRLSEDTIAVTAENLIWLSIVRRRWRRRSSGIERGQDR